MDNYVIKELRTSEGVYRWDYTSLVNLPDLTQTIKRGTGISVDRDGTDSVSISLDPTISEDIGDLLNEVFPMKAIVTSLIGFGAHEVGDTVSPEASWRLERRGKTISSGYTVIPSVNAGSGWINLGSVDSRLTYSFPGTTEQTSYRVSIRPTGFPEISLGPWGVEFCRYRYYGVLHGRPTTVTEELVKSLGSRELTKSQTLGPTNLRAGEYFLFVVPGTPNLLVRHTGTDGVIDSETGTLEVTAENGLSSALYTWILAPASGIPWGLKITTT